MGEQSRCPECEAEALYRRRWVDMGSLHGPSLLPGLGEVGSFATATIVVCASCGLMRLYADKAARFKLPGREDWKKVT